MGYRLTIPARINILGNPSDANEGDFATISAAVDLRAHAIIQTADRLILEARAAPRRREFQSSDLPLPYTGELDLIKGAINCLHSYSAEFRQKLPKRGMHLLTWSDVPRQSGLAGSTLFVLLALAALRAHYQLDPLIHNDYVLAELAQRVESRELGIACGFADRYVPLFGGLAYLDYRGKLHQREIGQEPYVTYERLDGRVAQMPLVVVSTGIQHDSGDVHGRMRPRYLAEHDQWQREGGGTPPMVRFMQAAWETAWRGKIALLAQDWPTFGHLMNENHRIVDMMMSYCGFPDGAGWANNLLIESALTHGALGAKLTGAGGGGSVFALTRPGEEDRLMEAWQRSAQEAGLTKALIFRPRLSPQGLLVENTDE